jgi:hypothetical protein
LAPLFGRHQSRARRVPPPLAVALAPHVKRGVRPIYNAAMTEDLIEHLDTRGWALNAARLRLETYRLVVAILAADESQAWERETASWRGLPSEVALSSGSLARLTKDCESSEIEHGLIGVAAMARVLLDQGSPRGPERHHWCGTFVSDPSKPGVEQPLALREACNKILHATTRSFVLNTDGPPMVVPWMHLAGSQLGRDWTADLHVLSFAAHVAALTEKHI